jgi:hypothetical protein
MEAYSSYNATDERSQEKFRRRRLLPPFGSPRAGVPHGWDASPPPTPQHYTRLRRGCGPEKAAYRLAVRHAAVLRRRSTRREPLGIMFMRPKRILRPGRSFIHSLVHSITRSLSRAGHRPWRASLRDASLGSPRLGSSFFTGRERTGRLDP